MWEQAQVRKKKRKEKGSSPTYAKAGPAYTIYSKRRLQHLANSRNAVCTLTCIGLSHFFMCKLEYIWHCRLLWPKLIIHLVLGMYCDHKLSILTFVNFQSEYFLLTSDSFHPQKKNDGLHWCNCGLVVTGSPRNNPGFPLKNLLESEIVTATLISFIRFICS